MADDSRKFAVPRKSSVGTTQHQQGWNDEYQAKLDRIDQDTQLLKDAKKHPDPQFLVYANASRLEDSADRQHSSIYSNISIGLFLSQKSSTEASSIPLIVLSSRAI
ncbi:hypothetical protein LTR17_027298 [Elasticomyces elasticus]|nr:hypothetical protein LTR17_027298 [Elasticomyces elasticus]